MARTIAWASIFCFRIMGAPRRFSPLTLHPDSFLIYQLIAWKHDIALLLWYTASLNQIYFFSISDQGDSPKSGLLTKPGVGFVVRVAGF